MSTNITFWVGSKNEGPLLPLVVFVCVTFGVPLALWSGCSPRGSSSTARPHCSSTLSLAVSLSLSLSLSLGSPALDRFCAIADGCRDHRNQQGPGLCCLQALVLHPHNIFFRRLHVSSFRINLESRSKNTRKNSHRKPPTSHQQQEQLIFKSYVKGVVVTSNRT